MRVISTALLLALPLVAQDGAALAGATSPVAVPGAVVPGAFQPYGSACPGSGWPTGGRLVVPAATTTAFGNSNNLYPYGAGVMRYQQVFHGSEFPSGPVPVAGYELRQDDVSTGYAGHKVDLAVWLGGTTLDHTNLTVTFDANFDVAATPKTAVFARRLYALPSLPQTPETNPSVYHMTVPFDVPYVIHVGANHLLLEAISYGNTNGNQQFGYQLDSVTQGTTARMWALNSATAATGTVRYGQGLTHAFLQLGATPARPKLYHSDVPRVGREFHIGLVNAARLAQTVLILGGSDATDGGIPLPFDMAPLGAPACFLLASIDIALGAATQAGGDLPLTLPIPNDPSLDGKNLFVQHAVLDSAANALGIATSNGGALTIGM